MTSDSFNVNLHSLNVRGLRDVKERRAIFHWLRKFNQGIIFLQETHSCSEDESIWKNEWGANIVFSHGSRDSRGVAILFSNSMNYNINNCICNLSGRCILLEIEIDGKNFFLVNLYAPTKDHVSDQVAFLAELRTHLVDNLHSNFIFGGDFNTVLSSTMDKRGGRETPSTYRTDLLNFIEEFDLVDIWRARNPETFMHTWYSKSPLIQCRLDFWLVSGFLGPQVTTCKIVPSIKTDHSLISIELTGSNFKRRGPGFWKFNSSLLKEEVYVAKIKELIKNEEEDRKSVV